MAEITCVNRSESESTMQARTVNRESYQRDKPRQRLQRTLKSLPSDPVRTVPPPASPPTRHDDPRYRPMEPQAKPTPETEASQMPEIQYQCTSCDMMVSASDSYCPFCGAIFADDPDSQEVSEADGEERAEQEAEDREPSVRPQRFNNLSMVKPRPKPRELLYAEAMKGFTGSARLLEDIELLITDVSALGTDMTKARRLMSSAWEACREGDWPLVSALAKQTEDMMSPSIPDLVRSELGKARNLIVEAKSWGADTSRYMVTMKSAMNALHREDLDEALRLTKELIDSLREDSGAWKREGKGATSRM